MHPCGPNEQIKGIQSLESYVREMPEGNKNFNAKHGIELSNVYVEWDFSFDAVSASCNACNQVLTSYSIQSGVCPRIMCQAHVDLESCKRKWFWAKFFVKDINNENNTHIIFGTDSFSKQAIKKSTDNQICDIDSYIKVAKDLSEHQAVVNNIKKIVVPARIYCSRRNDVKENMNDVSLQIDIVQENK